MTKQEFKERWESNPDGGGITWDDVADVAKAWGVVTAPRARNMDDVLEAVLLAAGVKEEPK